MLSLLGLDRGASQPLKVHPNNPRILEYKGEPILLRAYGEFYGSVFNQGFNYIPYLNKLQQDGMNLTRVILVGFHGDTGDPEDTINPTAANYIQPWPRSTVAGNALDGLGKWDFSQWNPAYFTRLKNFVQACADRDIVVELTLFSTCYNQTPLFQWKKTAFNPVNNVQGIGPSAGSRPWFDVMRPTSTALFTEQREVVRKIVEEVNTYDNVYFEIQNEPFWNEVGVKDAEEVVFHNTMLSEIRNREATLPKRHLVAHNYPQQVNNLTNDFDIINCHYPFAVPSTPIIGGENLLRDFYVRNRVLSLDETTTAGPVESRLESWMFLLGGGGIYNGLDQDSVVYSMSNPAGTTAPGPAIRTGLRNLGNFTHALDLINLRRDLSWLVSGAHASSRRQGMSKPGQQYVMYFYHGSFSAPFQTVYSPIDSSNHTAALRVNLPAGSYRVVWTKPSNMSTINTETFTHAGGDRVLQSVTYQEDAVVRIDRTGVGDTTAPPPPRSLSATINPQSQILLNWSAASAADVANYRVFRYTGTGTPVFPSSPLTTLGAGTLSFVDTSAAQGSQHRYVVAAVDNQGNESRRSNIALAVAPVTLTPPTANAGVDQILFDNDQNLVENVTLNGSASTPGQRPIVSYVWKQGSTEIATGVNPTVSIAAGIRDIELVVTDDVGLTASDVVRVSISNTEFRNGSFENSLTGPFPNGASSALQTGLAGWTVNLESNPVKSSPSYVPRDGSATVLIFGGGSNPSGSSITQTFPTVPGRTYNIDLDMGVLGFNTNSQILSARIHGATLRSPVTFSQAGSTGANSGKLVWRSTAPAFSFVADSTVSSLILSDASTSPNGLEMIIDNVRVVAQGDRTLTLASQPTSSVAFTVTPTDLNNAGGGSTPFTRSFGNGTAVTITSPPLAGGQGFLRWLSNGVDIGSANPINLTLNSDITLTAVYGSGPPVILSQPVSMVKAVGESAALSVSAAGTGSLTYQWRFNSVPIVGANGQSYTIPSVSGMNAGTYDVVVTGSGGSTQSAAAVLSVPVPTFVNGSFEDGLNGWTVVDNAFLLGFFVEYEAADQTNLVVFNGGNSTPNGTISQQFATTPGATYRLSYHARIVSYTTDQQMLRMEINGASLLRSRDHTFSNSIANSTVWQEFSETFVADSALTTVKFLDQSTKTNAIDLLLDHIQVLAQSPVQFAAGTGLTANPQAVTTNEDTPLPIVLSSSGGNGGSVSYQVLVGPANGDFSGTAPNLTYTPDPNFHGADSFTFKVNDGTVDSNIATVTITVNPVNDAPVAVGNSYSTPFNTPMVIAAPGLLGNDTDIDSATLTALKMSDPANGTVSVNANGSFTYTPGSSFNGVDSFTYKANDGILDSNTVTVSLTVSPPVANGLLNGSFELGAPGNLGSLQDWTVTGLSGPGGNDPYPLSAAPYRPFGYMTELPYYVPRDGNRLAILNAGSNTFDGKISQTISTIQGHQYEIRYKAGILNLSGNTAPSTRTQKVRVRVDGLTNLLTVTSDIAGPKGGTTWTANDIVHVFTADGPTAMISFDDNLTTVGSQAGQATASDLLLDHIRVELLSTGNIAPVANANSYSTAEDTPLTVSAAGLLANDTDANSNPLTAIKVTDPANGSVTINTNGGFTYTPNSNFNGADSFTYKANDGVADSDTATVSITVSAVNDAPVASIQSLMVNEDGSLQITLTGTDVDGNNLSFATLSDPVHGDLSGTAPNLTYAPDPNFHGSDSFTFTVSDGVASPVQGTIHLTVHPVNDLPVANNQAISTNEDSSVNITLTGSDADGDSLGFAMLSDPTHGDLSGTASNLTYTPDPNFHGSDSFTFTVSDGVGSPVQGTIHLTVHPVNDAPVATGQTLTIAKNIASSITLSGSDVDGNGLSYVVTAEPSHGELSGEAPNLTYTPDPDFFGADSFGFTVSDGVAAPVSALISITVAASDEPLPGLKVERLTGACRLILTPKKAGTYRIEWSDTLGSWETLDERVVNQSGDVEVMDNTANGNSRFYRACRRP